MSKEEIEFKEDITRTISILREFSIWDFVKYVLFKAINNANDLTTFSLYIDMAEIFLWDDLVKEGYLQDLQRKVIELNEKYGENPVREEDRYGKLKELTLFKLHKIRELIKKRTPEEVVGEV